jgi:hypothetical protein
MCRYPVSLRSALTGAVLVFAAATGCGASDYYKVQVTREGKDLYRVVGQDIYVKTRYCYEYAFVSEAILQIDATVGRTIGQIIFTNMSDTRCDVERLLK